MIISKEILVSRKIHHVSIRKNCHQLPNASKFHQTMIINCADCPSKIQVHHIAAIKLEAIMIAEVLTNHPFWLMLQADTGKQRDAVTGEAYLIISPLTVTYHHQKCDGETSQSRTVKSDEDRECPKA